MMRKIKEADPIVIDFLKNIFVSNQDEEEGVFETDEEIYQQSLEFEQHIYMKDRY